MDFDEVNEPGWTTSYHLYESAAAKHAVDLTAIEGDLEEALKALDGIDVSDGSAEAIVVHRALWHYALTLYTRLFAKGGNRPRVSVQLATVVSSWPAAQDVHEHVMGVRNKHVAHVTSDMERWGTAIALGSRGDGRYRMKAIGMVVTVAGPVADPIAADFRNLVALLLAEVRETVIREWEAVNDEIKAKRLTPADIMQLPPAPPVGGAGVGSWQRSRR